GRGQGVGRPVRRNRGPVRSRVVGCDLASRAEVEAGDIGCYSEGERLMASKVNAVPSGPHAITPYLTVKGAAKGIEFYKQAFGAVETMRWTGPDGRIGHAEIEISGTPVFISDEHPEIDVLSPETLGGSAVGLHLMVEDADATFSRALAAGATEIR